MTNDFAAAAASMTNDCHLSFVVEPHGGEVMQGQNDTQ